MVPGLSLVPIPAYASAPCFTIQGTAARVWTLWTSVGRPNRPRSASACGKAAATSSNRAYSSMVETDIVTKLLEFLARFSRLGRRNTALRIDLKKLAIVGNDLTVSDKR